MRARGYSRTEDHMERELLGYGNKLTKRGALTLWRRQRDGVVRTWKGIERARGHSLSEDHRERDLLGYRKRPTKREALTLWRRQREGFVRTRKEADRGRGTNFLETAKRGSCQDTERNRPSERHSPPGDDRGRDSLGQENQSTERGALTSWRRQREELVRIRKEIDRSRSTHFLETAGGGTRQDKERNRPSEGYSLPGDGKGRDLSGHRKKST